VSNLNGNCMRCLCYASTLCNVTVGCSRGYCGPYYLYRDYWKEAGQLVLPDDDPDRDQAFVDCASNVECAQKVVENYMVKWGKVSAKHIVELQTNGLISECVRERKRGSGAKFQ
jgi:hypothetical protein